MGRLRSNWFGFITVLFLIAGIVGCGGHKPAGTSPFASRISLTPGGSASLQAGTILAFTASAQNGTNNNVTVGFTWNTTDSSTLTLSPTGIACAGQWDSTYSICTPGTLGVAQVTASALGVQSPPTYVFVHAPIDNISVQGVLPSNQFVQEPCLSQGQSMTVEAHAFSQGLDITSSVGPFTWSANNIAVVSLTPIVTNFTYNVATNQATAMAATPGITQIYASASGVTSNVFQQPQYQQLIGGSQQTSPLLNFFETCPIQNITLEVGAAGSQQTGQTSFVTTKGTAQNVTAIVTDVMGNTSLQGANTPVLLSKIPLTWASSQPAVVQAPSSCQLSCGLTTPVPGSAAVMASCSPPTCNIGYPEAPAIFSAPTPNACTEFFQLSSCQQFIPVPVYASAQQLQGQPPPPGPGAISGVVTGATTAPSVLATSADCATANPLNCATSAYNVNTAKPVAGGEIPLPSSPTSMVFDLLGDKAYMGSEVGAISINPSNLGSSTNPFGGLGAVTGKVLAVSSNGNLAIFADNTLTPNQVFVVNTTFTSNTSVTALNIQGATTAAFSPDGLKAFIFGLDTTGTPNLYVYSTLQALQTIPLATGTTVNAITFSANGAFVYVVEPSAGGGGPAFTVYNMCNGAIATGPKQNPVSQLDIPLSAIPIAFKPLPDGVHFVALEQSGVIDYITATITGIPIATVSTPGTSICPMNVLNTVPPVPLNLGQGNIHPIDFFASPDGGLLYVLASDRSSVLVHNLLTGATTGIQLVGNALPIQGGMAADGGTIVIVGTDGMLHAVSTALGGSDSVQTSFPELPNYLNPFCTSSTINCALNLIAVKP